MTLPENVAKTFDDPASVKVLTSVGTNGQPHSIVCGSIRVVSPDTVIVGEILMKTTASNFAGNKKAAILVVAGRTSYLVNAEVKQRVSEGPMLDGMNEALAKMGLKASAVWLFEPKEVFDQSATPNAGKKIV